MSKPKVQEHRIGEVVELELPPGYGGKQKLQVHVGSSCIQCKLSGLGHTHCPLLNCGREARADGNSVVYKVVESGRRVVCKKCGVANDSKVVKACLGCGEAIS